MTKTALIIGVASQDGSYLAEFLLHKQYRVIGTIRHGGGDEEQNISDFKSQLDLETADLLDYASVSNVIKKYQPDEIYNLAALSLPSASWDQAYLTAQVTGLGPLLVLESIKNFSPQSRLFQASTREIFGEPSAETIDETTLISPSNPYGAAKTYAHFMAGIYRKTFKLFVSCGILFNHESPRRPLHFVSRKITAACACIKNNVKIIPVDSGGKPILDENHKLHLWDIDSPRDRGYAKDYVEAMWLMLQTPSARDYIIASGTSVTVSDMCDAAFSSIGLNWRDYVVVDQPAKPVITVPPVVGDASLIKADTGWSPHTPFRDVINLMVQADLLRFPS